MSIVNNNAASSLKHIAVIMDGNGRWAEKQCLPRSEGHQSGLQAARQVVESAAALGVKYLTLFAFSDENWHRPQSEISALFSLFTRALADAGEAFNRDRICLRFIGERSRFPKSLQVSMNKIEQLTNGGDKMTLTLAIGYSGKWDILNAATKIAASGGMITEENFSRHLATGEMPPPDLLIRTGGEMRISNFMLWQTAYTELYFTDTLWPDFTSEDLAKAVDSFKRRERRFGRVVATSVEGE